MLEKIEVRPLAEKWFDEATPANYDGNASATIGSGTNGRIELTHSGATTTDVVEITIPTVDAAACAVSYASGKLTIALAVSDNETTPTADLDANKAGTIATAINAVSDCPITAVASGDGTGKITAATSEDVEFTDGCDGTPCPYPGIALFDSTNSLYYVCETANNTTKNAGWKKFSLQSL